MVSKYQLKNRLSDSIKKKKHEPIICSLGGNNFKHKGTNSLKANRQKMKYLANTNERKAEVALLILDKVDFRTKILPG